MMPGKIITIAQQKGGAGKTTLAAQLAVALLDKHTVATIDIDPQGSLSLWHEARVKTLGDKNRLFHSQTQGWRLKKEADRLAEDYEYVIIDSPPHTETEANIAIRSSEITIIPMQPSPMDLWASRPTIETAQQENSVPFLVLNRVDPRTNLNAMITEKAKELDCMMAKTALGNRTAYAASMLEGLGVTEFEKSGTAAKEIKELVAEIRNVDALKLKKAA